MGKNKQNASPLTDLVGKCGQTKVTKAKGTKKVPCHWNEVHHKSFDLVKATIVQDVVLAYPGNSEPFEIYSDSSAYTARCSNNSKNRPLAFFSRKVSETQIQYSVTKIELLVIVEILKEFKGMLWGQLNIVYTDYKSLTEKALGLTSDRVYRWRFILKEFGPKISYKENT